MNHDERQLIDGLFGRLQDAERTAPPRDGEADRFIQERVASQPGAPYYMAQTIIVQEQALEAAQARIEELERNGSRASAGGGGLLGSLFGGGASGRASAPSRPMGAPQGYGANRGMAQDRDSPWSSRGSVPSAGGSRMGGGGFLAGAAQTAVGVAGGMMLGSMLGGMFAGDAQADELSPLDETGTEDMGGAEDMGGMDDGGMGDFEL